MSADLDPMFALASALNLAEIANDNVLAAASALIDSGKSMAAVAAICDTTAPTMKARLDARTARLAQAASALS